MRLPLATSLKSRNGLVTKDAIIVNGVVESDPNSGESAVYKRPGNQDLGLIRSGKAQLLYYWNGVKAIIGDFLSSNIPLGYTNITTWNPADKGSFITLSGGNLTQTGVINNLVRSVLSVTSGAWYWENTIITFDGLYVGMANINELNSSNLAATNNSIGYFRNGGIYNNNVVIATGAAYTNGDIIGIFYSASSSSIAFYKNGVLQYTATGANVPTGALYAAAGCNGSGGASTANFGATSFTYQPSASSATLSPSTAGLPFSAQDSGSNAATAYLMFKNANQAWTLTANSGATPVQIVDPDYPGTYTVGLTSLTRVGTVATATTAADTNFQVGSTVTIAGATPSAYNGAQVITGVTPSSVTTIGPVTIGITRVGTTATAVSSAPHKFTNGQSIVIAGANETAYNGTYVITWISAISFSFSVTLSGASFSTPATGTIVVKPTILIFALNAFNNLNVFQCTYASAHFNFFQNGDIVSITSSISGVVSAATGATFTLTTTGVTTVFDTGYGLNSGIPILNSSRFPLAITSIISDGTIAIVTTVAAHNLSTQTLITVLGANQSIYNVINAAVIAISANSFSYILSSALSPPLTATGNISATNIISNGASFTFTIAGSPATPATGTITAVGGRNTVPGIVYINGYFCVMDVFGVIYNSAPDNPSQWNALEYTTAEAETGAGMCLARSQSYVVAFKEWSTEFFYDARNPIGSPLAPVSNGFIKIGCASGFSVAELEDELIWMSQTRQKGRGVYIMKGTSNQKISTEDIERVLNKDNLIEVFSYAIKINGHGLYVLTLVNTNITLVYDMVSQSWTQWSSLTVKPTQSITSISQVGGVATVTFATAHNIADGDPVIISGAVQADYNGIFQTSYISATVLTINVNTTAVTPATGTILGAGYTESYFQFTKFANALGQYLVLHNTDGHLYEIKPELNQDAGIPINTFFRTIRLDGGDLELQKVMYKVIVVGDTISDVIMLRQSNDDSVSFSLYRPVNLLEPNPSLRRLGGYRRRSIELKHNTNNAIKLTALEIQSGV